MIYVTGEIGKSLVKAYEEVLKEKAAHPESDTWFEKVGIDRNLVAAFTEAVVTEIMKKCGLGAYGVIKEGIEWGFKAIDERTEGADEIASELSYTENLKRAIRKREK